MQMTGGDCVGSTTTVTTAPDEGAIFLPGCRSLDQATVKELNLTAEQTKKLREIQPKYQSDESNFYSVEAKKLSEGELMKAFAKQHQDHIAGVRKKVEEVLTPQQMQALKGLTLRGMAFAFMAAPEQRQKLGLATQQESKLRVLSQEVRDGIMKNAKEHTDKALAVLSPQQRANYARRQLAPWVPLAMGPSRFTSQARSSPSTSPRSFPIPTLAKPMCANG